MIKKKNCHSLKIPIFPKKLKTQLFIIYTELFNKCGLTITSFTLEAESNEYQACRFLLNGKAVIGRTAKITPKKTGQFVTFWKRNSKGITTPFSEEDNFSFYVIIVKKENQIGQFVFPKAILLTKGIIATTQKDGKRGFRVYPPWDTTTSTQAEKTQRWQNDYFYAFENATDTAKVRKLFGI